METLLNKNRNKKSQNLNGYVDVGLESTVRILPTDEDVYKFSSEEQERREREQSNTVRLTLSFDALCSNVLFNNITEIVKKEGSNNVVVANNGQFNVANAECYCGKTTGWTHRKAIRDTQLSSERGGFEYHCGLDIFNNHTLRNKTFRSVCGLNEKSTNNVDIFNTIEDYMRDGKGRNVLIEGNSSSIYAHLYGVDDILSFESCAENKLEEQDGWVGFKNGSSIPVFYEEDGIPQEYPLLRTICNKVGGAFVDMYPSRDLYSPIPKYNQYRKRYEENWKVYLTYPYSSTTDVEFIDKETNSLKCAYIDECPPTLTNGSNLVFFYSVSKHGLSVGDTVNIYKNFETEEGKKNVKIYESAKVVRLGDGISDNNDFVFAVRFNGKKISNRIIPINRFTKKKFGEPYVSSDIMSLTAQSQEERSIATYEISDSLMYVTKTVDGNKTIYPVVNGRVNVDDTAQDVSYKKTVDGEEIEYYVRLFTLFPNWKNATVPPTEENWQEQSIQCAAMDFSTHKSILSFAKNPYGDKKGMVTYMEDIDLSFVKDNLGRPVSELFATIVKNNRGYDKWYGKNNSTGQPHPSSEDVEFSHCFGKLTAGFELSDASLVRPEFPNVRLFQNIDEYRATPLDMAPLRSGYDEHLTDDEEISPEFTINFYGDLCAFSKKQYIEESIDMSCIRFNTAQRELVSGDATFNIIVGEDMNYTIIYTDEIFDDDYGEGFNVISGRMSKGVDNQRKEGYYYVPHFPINIHEIGKLEYVLSNTSEIRMTYETRKDGTKYYHIKTYTDNYLEKGNECTLYCSHNFYKLEVCNVFSNREFSFSSITLNGVELEEQEITDLLKKGNLKNITVIQKPSVVPSYAVMADDGNFRYTWRDIIHNGSRLDCKLSPLPFTNNCFYAHSDIRLYLKRQDPFENICDLVLDDKWCLQPKVGPFALSGFKYNVKSNNEDGYNENSEPCM